MEVFRTDILYACSVSMCCMSSVSVAEVGETEFHPSISGYILICVSGKHTRIYKSNDCMHV